MCSCPVLIKTKQNRETTKSNQPNAKNKLWFCVLRREPVEGESNLVFYAQSTVTVPEGEEGEKREEGKVARRVTGHSNMADTGRKMWGMVTVGCQEQDRFAHIACSLACPPPDGRVGGWRGGWGENGIVSAYSPWKRLHNSLFPNEPLSSGAVTSVTHYWSQPALADVRHNRAPYWYALSPCLTTRTKHVHL